MLRRARAFYKGAGRASLLVRSVAGSFGLRIFGMGFGFLVGVQLARGLGPYGYGVYGVAMSVISLMMIPTEFGLPQLVTREVAAAGAAGDTGLLYRLVVWSGKFVLFNSLGLALIAAAVLLWSGFEQDVELFNTLMWGLLLVPIVATSNVLAAALRGLHRIIEGQVSELLLRPGALSVMLLMSAVWLGGGFLTPSYAMAFNVITASFGAAYVIWQLGPFLRRRGDSSLLSGTSRKWLTSALPLAMGDGMRILSGQIAILVLGATVGNSEAGLYRVAFGVYTVATLPSALLNSVCSPMLSTLHGEGRHDALQRLNSWMVLFLVTAAIACIVPFAISGKSIIGFIFGPAYEGSNSILLILLIGEFFASLLGHPTIVLTMLRHERAVVWYSFFALLMNLLICLLLVPLYGGVGAALGVALSQVAWRLGASLHARRHLGLHTNFLSWFNKSERR